MTSPGPRPTRPDDPAPAPPPPAAHAEAPPASPGAPAGRPAPAGRQAPRPDAVLRLIDASANRAREALRVMEDTARFALDDRSMSEALKNLRHDLRRALELLPVDRAALAGARDTPGDVGTTLSAPGEHDRPSVREVALAASARLGEALRSLEEGAKVLDATGRAPREIEGLRYRAYTLERWLALALPTGRARQWRLCVLITAELCTHHPWERVAEFAIDAGAEAVQLREKALSDRELLARARRLVQIAGGRADVIINDRPDVAALAGATGVHLGQEDLPAPDVRRLFGHRLVVGVSCATPEQARGAFESGADYLGLGPMFPSTTKRKPVISGPELLQAVLGDAALSTRPHVAISGIGPENVATLLGAGCRGVAVSSAVCSASNPMDACRRLLRALEPG